MRKHVSAIIAILTAAAVITGCQTKENAPSSDGAESTASKSASTTSKAATAEADTPVAATAEAETPVVVVTAEPAAPTAEVSAPEDEAVTPIKPGTWRGTDSYFFFNDDGRSVSTIDFSDRRSFEFEYELTQNGHMILRSTATGESVSLSYTIDGDTLSLMNDINGSAIDLLYVSEKNVDTFKFYTNNELCIIAQRYYESNLANSVESIVFHINDDGTLTVRFNENDENPASYTIDRVTLLGTDDITQTPADFTAYADDSADAIVN